MDFPKLCFNYDLNMISHYVSTMFQLCFHYVSTMAKACITMNHKSKTTFEISYLTGVR
jgi:hypothetical protein